MAQPVITSKIALPLRLAGGVWGHLVGDAMGVPYEFREPGQIGEVRFGETGTHGQPPGTWSDDGALMLALLDSLLEVGFDTEDQGRRALTWRRDGAYTSDGEVFDIGTTTSEALRAIEQGTPAEQAGGASDHPLGGLGFASWAREVEAQEAELGVFFDTIIVCSVTGSTQAGMIAGFAIRDRERRVIGIDGSAKPDETRAQVARIARFTAKAIGLERDLRDDEIILDDRYHAGVYGIPDESTLAAMRLAAGLEAMITDPVYEGKSMAGLIDLVSRGEIERSSNVLYAHLGGQPAINGYAGLFS